MMGEEFATSENRAVLKTYIESRLESYLKFPKGILESAGTIRGLLRDHGGRWPYELIQNAVDGNASEVTIRFRGDRVYVANDGSPLSRAGVESLAMAHFSEKAQGLSGSKEFIGNRGVGFKSVFDIATRVCVFSDDDFGMEFSLSIAKCHLDGSGLLTESLNESDIPVALLPGFLSRSAASADDDALAELEAYNFVVRLDLEPGAAEAQWQQTRKDMREWLPDGLLFLQCLDSVKLESEEEMVQWRHRRSKDDPPLHITEETDTDRRNLFRLYETQVSPPEELLDGLRGPLTEGELRHLRSASAAWAVPLDEEGRPRRLGRRSKIHVFYPTEDSCPLPMLLHADFLTDLTRTHIVKRASGKDFNAWMMGVVADQLVEVLHEQYSSDTPEIYLELVARPHKPNDGSFTDLLLERLLQRLREKLLLPSIDGTLSLGVRDALVPPAGSFWTLSYDVLEGNALANRLVHPALAAHRRFLRDGLKTESLNDEMTIDVIRTAEKSVTEDRAWFAAAAEWACRFGEQIRKSESEYSVRSKVNTLPVLCLENGTSGAACEFEDDVDLVRRGQGDEVSTIPPWLPVRAVDPVFLHLFLERLGDDKSLKKWLPEIRSLDWEAVLSALNKAVGACWKENSALMKEEPDAPLRFITRNFEALVDASNARRRKNKKSGSTSTREVDGLSMCPIPCRRNGQRVYERAWRTFLGTGWSRAQDRKRILLERVLAEPDAIAFVDADEEDSDETKELKQNVLKAIGVSGGLLPTSERDIELAWQNPRFELYADYAFRKCAAKARVFHGRDLDAKSLVDSFTAEFPDVELDQLSPTAALAFLFLVSSDWSIHSDSRIETLYFRLSNRHKYYEAVHDVDSSWWYYVRNQLNIPLVCGDGETGKGLLKNVWLPLTGDEAAFPHSLLDMIDFSSLEPDEAASISEFLRDHKLVRTQLGQLSGWQWSEILDSLRICYPPELLARDGNARRDVRIVYHQFCQNREQRTEVSEERKRNVSLAAHRDLKDATQWEYRPTTEIWIIDQPRWVSLLGDRVWALIDIPGADLEALAEDLGIRRTSQNLEVQVRFGLERCRAGLRQTLRDELGLPPDEYLPHLLAAVSLALDHDLDGRTELTERLLELEVVTGDDMEAWTTIETETRRFDLEVPLEWHVLNNDKAPRLFLELSESDATLRRRVSDAVAAFLGLPHKGDGLLQLLTGKREETRSRRIEEWGYPRPAVRDAVSWFRNHLASLSKPETAPPPIDTEPEPHKPGTDPVQPPDDEPKPYVPPDPQPTPDPPEPRPSPVPTPPSPKPPKLGLRDVSRLCLRRTDRSVEVVHKRLPSLNLASSGGGGGRGGGGSGDGNAENLELEDRSRDLCSRILADQGWGVQQMPGENPGYDLLATRDNEILLIEVKAHRSRVRYQTISPKQFQASLAPAIFKEGARWELWVVHNLGEEAPEPVRIETYPDLDKAFARGNTVTVRVGDEFATIIMEDIGAPD